MIPGVTRTCPLCGESAGRILQDVDGWRIVSCRRCRFVYAPVIRADTSDDDRELPEGYEPPRRARYEQIHRLLTNVLPAGSTIVEVGAGFGTFGVVTAEAGSFGYVGFEPALSNVAQANLQGISLRREFFDRNSLDESADAIVLDNVTEHVADPASLLADCVASLRPGGVLVVIVPNRWDVRQLRTGWRRENHWIPPQHINYFSARSLRRVLRSLGLRVRPFGFRALGPRDWRYFPRAAMEVVGIYPFGLNVYGFKST